jgi:hypothetical protein
MAQKRMLDKKISVSEQVANLTDRAKLVFTWAMPHADDIGMLPYSLKTLKATIIPMVPMELEEFEGYVKEIVGEGLWQVYEFGGMKFYRLVKFAEHQTLKKDRQPQTILPIAMFKDARETWKQLEDIDFHLEGDGFQPEDGVPLKRREVKRSEEKRSEGSSVAGAPTTPKNRAKAFFMGVAQLTNGEDVPWLQDFLRELASRNNVPKVKIWNEIKAFCHYWTERNSTGVKERWELQKTFEVDKRLLTWFKRAGVNGFSTGSGTKGKEIIGLD